MFHLTLRHPSPLLCSLLVLSLVRKPTKPRCFSFGQFPAFSGEVVLERKTEDTVDSPCAFQCSTENKIFSPDILTLPVSRDCPGTAQRADPTLQKCFAVVVSADSARNERVSYVIDNGMLLRRWSPIPPDLDWSVVFQLVVPSSYRSQVLTMAHESQWCGHLGVTKTYQHILKYFYWPGLKSDVTLVTPLGNPIKPFLLPPYTQSPR